MSDWPPTASPGSPNPDESPSDRLQAGLAALKQHEYPQALQSLSKLAQDRTVPGAVRLKAHIGLAQALHASGQTTKAIAIAQKLAAHPQAKVHNWANAALRQWSAASAPPGPAAAAEPSPPAPPAPPTTDASGFTPLEAAATRSSKPTTSSPKPAISPPGNADLSGFQPLDSTDDAPVAVQGIPLPSSADSMAPVADSPASTSTESVADSVTEPDETAIAPPTNDSTRASDTTQTPEWPTSRSSLFHYEQLNQTQPETTTEPLSPPDESRHQNATTDHPVTPPATLQFQHGERLQRLRSLPKKGQDNGQVWLVMGLSAIALVWLSRLAVQAILSQISRFIRLFDRILPFSPDWSYQKHTFLTVGLLLVLLLASPWLLDWLLKYGAGLKSLPMSVLRKTHPESGRLLRRLAQKHSWTLPLLQELPTDTPLIFSYGWAPRYSRIVISRGLLNQLDEPELATLMGYELTHTTRRLLPYMSLVALLLQAFHQGYWQLAQWGDRTSGRATTVLAAIGSTVCYTLYWLVRKLHLPLSRVRVLGSDRQAVQWTGNPNALTRALIKLEQGIAAAIAQTGYTPPLVESTDVLTPCGVETAITPGSLLPDITFLDALYWDIQNPYRRWLSFNSSHPRLGERLQRLTAYAQRWSLSPEIPFPAATAPSRSSRPASFWDNWGAFLTQIMPYIGPLLGVVVAMLLWFLGGIFEPLGLRRIGWVYGDRGVLRGTLFLGLGMGIMARINTYFPDITSLNRRHDPPLSTLLDNPQALPTDSQPLRLSGTLLGRPGMANWLCQDMILKTPRGLLKLHFLSILGAFGNLLIHPQHPSEYVGRELEVQGWYRRSAIAWLDVEMFRLAGRVVAKANHPMWSVVLSLTCCGLGLFVLLRG